MHQDCFDTLARSLAQGTSRRSALKLIGAFISGSLLASLGRERAGAQSNSDAAHFCQALPPGPSRGQCVSDAAHGTGLFVQCQGVITRLCQGIGTATCCTGGQTCQNGACTSAGGTCTTDSDCAPGIGCPASASIGFCSHNLRHPFCVCGFPA